jgi:hypothetical protein
MYRLSTNILIESEELWREVGNTVGLWYSVRGCWLGTGFRIVVVYDWIAAAHLGVNSDIWALSDSSLIGLPHPLYDVSTGNLVRGIWRNIDGHFLLILILSTVEHSIRVININWV